MDAQRKTRVLFLCTHNAARSQMAEALLRHHAGDLFEVHSAGLEPTEIHPLTYKVMAEKGFDLAGQRSKSLMEYFMKRHIGYLITVCASAEQLCPTMPYVGERLYWPVEDPSAGGGSEEEQMARFRAARDELEGRVVAWANEMRQELAA